MSALTKVFVVLHVVVSLLLAAGLIVFVNRQENFKQVAKVAEAKAAVADRVASLKEQEIQKISAEKDVLGADLRTQIDTLGNDVKNQEAKVREKDGTIAELTSNVAQITAEKVSLTNQLAAKDTELATRVKANGDIQAKLDDREKKYVDLNLVYNSIINERDVFRRHDKYMAEVNTDLQNQLAQANETLKKYGITVGSLLQDKGVLNREAMVNINGVVRQYQMINGVPFATISLGSADAVTRGMQFKVIDPVHSQFLGYLTVDTVNVHDATGRLEGPGVTQVRPAVTEVRTQLN